MSNDQLILVDERDEPVGSDTRAACHSGDGVLHRAFSIYLYRHERLLLQKRSARKQLWPQHWSNSCCSHPRWGEDLDAAAHRRLVEELGVRVPLQALFKFQYRARFGERGSEHELCTVFIGAADDVGVVDSAEVEAWRYVDPDDLDRSIGAEPDAYTPWLRLAWQRLRGQHWHQIDALSGAV
jgi:isopentenyl-diphosphate delta-isomerase